MHLVGALHCRWPTVLCVGNSTAFDESFIQVLERLCSRPYFEVCYTIILWPILLWALFSNVSFRGFRPMNYTSPCHQSEQFYHQFIACHEHPRIPALEMIASNFIKTCALRWCIHSFSMRWDHSPRGHPCYFPNPAIQHTHQKTEWQRALYY